MPKSKLTKPVVLTVRRTFCEMDFSNIICNAMESGVYGSSWLKAYEAEAMYGDVENEEGVIEKEQWIGFKITKPKGNSKRFAEGNEEPALHTDITIASIVQAIEKLNSNPEACEVYPAFQFNMADPDAPMSDLAIQVAVFGKVIYG